MSRSLRAQAPLAPCAEGSAMRQTRGSFLAGAASALAACTQTPMTDRTRETFLPSAVNDLRLVIVGAGVAGLTCAYRLRQAGMVSRVFEASDRIGEFISLGQVEAQRLAGELGLQLVNVNRREPGHDSYFFDDDRYTVAQARTDYFAYVREPLRAAARASGYPTKYNRSTAACRTLDRTSVADWIDANVPDGLSSRIGALLANACVGEYGADPAQQSALNLIYLIGLERLSPLKRVAIDNLELGTNAKLHMQFKRRVWNAEHFDGSSYVQFPYEESWDVSAARPGDYGIVVGFPGGRRGVLAAAAHGPAPEAIAREYVRELDRVYPGIAALYTGVAYLDVWAHDPWHHGAYSYYGVGQYTRFAGIEPVPEGNVFFAGEQTSYNDTGYQRCDHFG
jgi:monoamine oxidase